MKKQNPCEIVDIKACKILIIWVTLQNEDNWSKAEAETGVLQNYGHKRNVARHVDVVIRDQMPKIKRDYTFISENIHQNACLPCPATMGCDDWPPEGDRGATRGRGRTPPPEFHTLAKNMCLKVAQHI